jgi:HK97 family phage major capsid protein
MELLDAVDQRVAPFRRRIDDLEVWKKGANDRFARSPNGGGGSGSPEFAARETLTRQLVEDAGFQQFLKSAKTMRSSFAMELRVPERKATTPVSGLSPTQAITSRIWGGAAAPLRLRELLPILPVTSGSVEYVVESSFVPTAAVVPETTVKPPLDIAFTNATAKVATTAAIVKASLQGIADAPMLSGWLDGRLRYAVGLKEEGTILNGDVGNSISGLLQLATPFTYVPQTGDTAMDVIGQAAGALMGQGYAVDGLVLNSADYTAMRLLKASTGQYIFMGTASTPPDDESVWEGTPSIWSIPTVISPAMPAGRFLLGAFSQGVILFDRQVMTVEVAFQNEDDFIRNLLCLRGESRSVATVPVPAALLTGSLPAGSLTTREGTPVHSHPSGIPVKAK